MRRLAVRRLVLALLVAAAASASCVRHVELSTHADAAIDAAYVPDASIDGSTIDASLTGPDAPPDSSIDAL